MPQLNSKRRINMLGVILPLEHLCDAIMYTSSELLNYGGALLEVCAQDPKTCDIQIEMTLKTIPKDLCPDCNGDLYVNDQTQSGVIVRRMCHTCKKPVDLTVAPEEPL